MGQEPSTARDGAQTGPVPSGESLRLAAHFAYGSGLAFSSDLQQGVADLRRMESAGLHMAWVGESYWLDAPTMLGYLAAKTSTLQLGPSILSVYSRSAAAVAQTAAGLDYVSGGRAVLGLGVSGPSVVSRWHDTEFIRPLHRLTTTVRTCRQVWSRQPIPLSDGSSGLRLMHRPTRPSIPIYVAALGPRAVEFAAAEADGWLTNMFWPERADDVWGQALERGLARRSQAAGPLQVVAGGMVAIDDDTERVLAKARDRAAFYVGAMGPPGKNFYYDVLVRYGYAAEAEEIRAHYLAKDPKRAAAAVPEEFVRQTNLIGTASFVRSRVEAYRKAGVTILNIVPLAGDVGTVVEALRDWSR